jgi:hypothetical protein
MEIAPQITVETFLAASEEATSRGDWPFVDNISRDPSGITSRNVVAASYTGEMMSFHIVSAIGVMTQKEINIHAMKLSRFFVVLLEPLTGWYCIDAIVCN